MAAVIVIPDGPAVQVLPGENTAQATASAALAQAWAEGTEPGGAGTKSAKEWAGDAALSSATAEAASGPTYASTAAGLAATTNGQAFAVGAGGGLVSVYLNSAGTAVLQRTLATTAYLASSAGAGAIGFTQGAGAVTRTVQDKLRERISVKDFGAVGDGVANDTTAIQNAIAHAATLAGTQQVEVFFPTGDYLHDNIVVASSRIVLSGDARLVKNQVTGDGITFDGTAGELFQCGIDGLLFGARSACSSGAAVKFFKCNQSVFKGGFKPFPAALFNGLVVSECAGFTMLPYTFAEGCLGDGITFSDSLDIYANASRSDGNTGKGWRIDVVSGIYATGCTAFGNGAEAWSIEATITPVRADANGFHFYTSCVGDTSGSHNWSMKQLGNAIFNGCWGASQSGATADKHGFFLDGCFEIEFSGCIGLNNNGCGFRDGGAVASANILINGGRFNNNGKVVGSAIRAGVSLRNSCDYTLSGVRMSDTRAGGSKTQQHGLQIDATLVALNISDCDMRGNASAPYSFAAVPTTFRHSNNLTGETASYASATSVTISPFIDKFALTGTTDTYDFVPKWDGREIIVRTISTAKIVGTTFGGAFQLPTAVIQPGANGTASFVSDGTNWYCTGFQTNDNT